ncbi:MAG: alcohol dehydrogenase catalytic domain-containing protein [bacterium]|nr:alcohol dehydrogenase catalytic domain-containing protein [bacterium]
MTQTIQALRLNGSERIDPRNPGGSLTRNLAVEHITTPEPGPGEILAEPLFVGVCGSDSSASLGKSNFSWVERPRTIGHECSARVVAFGPGAQGSGAEGRDTEGWAGLKVGDLFTPIPQRGCGDPRCRGCRRGRWNYCPRKQILGFHRDGALAQRMVLEADRCVPLRPGLSPQHAALVEPLSVVTQAIQRKCTIRPGDDVVVTGCGIMGLMAAELARAAGARVAITGMAHDRDVRLKLAAERGFTPIVVAPDQPLHERLAAGVEALDGSRFGDDFEDGRVDVLLECSGAPTALAQAGLCVHPEGTICVIATYPDLVPFEATAFTRAGQQLVGVMGSSREDFVNAQLLIERGVFDPEPYTRPYSFDNVIDALADSMAARTTKAVLQIHGA